MDGPYHFTCNTEQPLGHTLLRCGPPTPETLHETILAVAFILLLVIIIAVLQPRCHPAHEQYNTQASCCSWGDDSLPQKSLTIQPHQICRRRLLRAKGWTVLSVPYFEWYSGGDNTSHVEIDKVATPKSSLRQNSSLLQTHSGSCCLSSRLHLAAGNERGEADSSRL